MLTAALGTLRTRWVTFIGSFLALALGVGLLTTMGLGLAASLEAPERQPERFARAAVVVQGTDVLRVPTPIGDRTRTLEHPRPVPLALAGRLGGLGPTVADRSFPVRAPGAPRDLVGHPWSTAAFAPYEIRHGRAPQAEGEVLATGDWARPGQRLTTDRGPVTVVGTAPGLGFENALFYPDAQAARLSPAIDRLVVTADPAAVEAAAGPGFRVLTGTDRRYADPDPERDAEALVAVNALLGTAGGVTGFVSVFVVASTFAFAVAQRRKEFALLRTAGATPPQIRRTVLAEAVLVGTLASAAGCLLGAAGAPVLARRLAEEGIAPRWFAIGDHIWPYHLAFWTGLLVALAGAATASWRAGRVGPVEALRAAAVETGAMTRGRWAGGLTLLAAGLGLLAYALLTDPAELPHRKTYTSRPMLLIVAFALLAPVLVRPLTRLLAWLPAQLPGAGGMLVRENTAAGVRRTAAVAAPVLVTVALAGSLLGTTATLTGAKTAEIRRQSTADFVVTGGTGFDSATLDRLRAVPGAEVSTTARTALYTLEDGVALIRSEARAADPAGLARTAALPLAAGRVEDLDDDSVIVNAEWARKTVGSRVEVWLGDGTRKSLRIAAVLHTGTGNNGVWVTPANAPGAAVDRVDVAVAAGADRTAVGAALARAADRTGATVSTKEQWVDAVSPAAKRTTRIGFLLVLGIALLYTGIAVANTMVMATADRLRDLEVLRLAGATRRQVLRLVAGEALLVVTVGAVVGALAAGVNLLGLWGALGLLEAPAALVVPWQPLGAVLGACAAAAVLSAVIPAGLALGGVRGVRAG
ncbi:ABC transporter permease [Streptomyces sp. NPDC002054]|uniref:ABC transporter permease n=1 Tax=Streptomyces sp. NPDC002054 TaxID=3154663 RepID=UPI003318976B